MADSLEDFLKKALGGLSKEVGKATSLVSEPVAPVAPIGDSPSGAENPAISLPRTSWYGLEGESSKEYSARAKGIEVDLQGDLQRRLLALTKAGYDVEYVGEGSNKAPRVVRKVPNALGTGTTEEVVSADDPLAAAFYNADSALREFSRIKGAGGFTDPAAGSGSGGGATQKYDAVSLSDMFTNFAKRAGMVDDLQDADQAYSMKASAANAAHAKGLLNGDYHWGTPGMGFYGTERPFGADEYAQTAADAMTWAEPLSADWFQPAALVPRFAEGTAPSMFDFAALLKQLQIPGLAPTGSQSSTTAAPGYLNQNNYLPPSEWQYGGQGWRSELLDTMIRNIGTGKAASPVGWSIDLSQYAGQKVPDAVAAQMADLIRKDPNNPDLVYLMGGRTMPTDIAGAYTTGPVDPYKFNADVRANIGTALDLAAFDLKLKEFQAQRVANASRSSGGSMPSAAALRSMMGGGSSIDDAEARRLALAEKAQAEEIAFKYASLKLDEEIQRGKLTLDQDRFEEEKRQQVFQDAYMQAMTKQIADNHDLALLKFAEDKTNAEFSRNMETAQFEEAKRRAAILEQQDREKLGIARAQAIADYGARGGGDAVARQFFMNNAGPVTGTAKDIFTGEVTGQKTWEQTQEEDAPVYWGNSFAPTLQTMATGGYSTSPFALVGDRASGRATGHEEMVINPTGAPFAVISNDVARRLGIVPPPGKKLPANIFAGVPA